MDIRTASSKLNDTKQSVEMIERYMINTAQEWSALQNNLTALGQEVDNGGVISADIYNAYVDEYNNLVSGLSQHLSSFVSFEKK